MPTPEQRRLDAGLVRVMRPRPVRTIAVTSGKGGVGKTSVSVNLALAFTELGREVMLLDADLGLANVDVMLGLHARYDLSHVVRGQMSLEEVIVTGPMGVRIVPAASGVKGMAELGAMGHAGLVNAFSELAAPVDVFIIDTAAGVADSVITFTRAAHEVLVVVCDEPASITDAYALMKLLSREYGVTRYRIVANMVNSVAEGEHLFQKIARVAARFLDVTLDYAGHVPMDEYLRRAVQKQRAVVEAYPRSRSASAFKNLARTADRWPMPENARGHLEFFVERMVRQDVEPPRIAV